MRGFWRRKPESLNLDEWVGTFFNPQIHSGTRMAEQIRKAASSVTLTATDIFEIYYKVPAVQRKNSHWVMSHETRKQIEDLPEVRHDRAFGHMALLIGKPIRIDPEAVGVRLVPECTCDLVDISNAWDPTHFAYARGKTNGCLVHATNEERREIAEREAWAEELRRRDEAAMHAAREAP